MRYNSWFKIILLVLVGIFLFEHKAYSISNTQILLATSTTNPTGTYSSGIKTLEGYSRMKGLIVINSNNSPAAYINQAVDAQSALDGTWHSTDTVTFAQSGSLWKGEIDISIFGGFANLTIGSFGTATFNKVNWYASIETSVSTTVNTSVVGTVTATAITTTSVTYNIITVGTTSTQLLASNSSRHNLLVINIGTVTDGYYMLAATATVGSGTVLTKSNGSDEPDFTQAIYTGAVSAITSTGTTSLAVREY